MITTFIEDKVQLIKVNNPPVNALSSAVRTGVLDTLNQAINNDEILSVVVICEGRTFFAGADIKEFGKPPVAPVLSDLINSIEQSPKPVVAAIHGTALGGGLELALGCHYRIAVQSAKLGLPEVKLGILPGAGGTQRLPRLIGVKHSLPMVVLGQPISASKAAEVGLIDQIVDGKLLEEAIKYAKSISANNTHARTSERQSELESEQETKEMIAQFKAKHARKLRGQKAPEACFEALQAAVNKPFSKGVVFERELFLKLVEGEQSKALRYSFFAERTATKIDKLPAETEPLVVEKVGILGAGTMGGGIAMNFLSAGFPVTIVEREQSALDRGIGIINKNYAAMASKGRISQQQADTALGLLHGTLDFDELADRDLIIEAVFEDMSIKRDVFARLDKTAKQGAILASNTSYLNLNEIANATSRPESVIGLHFFSPANIMKLLEVVRGEKTSPAVLQTAMKLAKKIGKVAVVSGVCDGFIGNRMLTQRQDQARSLILEGAKPWDIDKVITEFGFPMGPFQMSDLAGLDIGWNAETSSSSTVLEVLCEHGRRGQKTNKGYYDYDENRRSTPSEETTEIIDQFIVSSGKPQRSVSEDEILARSLYPMVNEGAKILQEGIAQRASDIDVVWLNGYGWPSYTGGPMFWADTVGIEKIVAGLREFDIEPAELLLSMLEDGKNFSQVTN